MAETTDGAFLSAELASNPQGKGAAILPEDLGTNCAKLLLEEIYRVSDASVEQNMDACLSPPSFVPQVSFHSFYMCTSGGFSRLFLNAAPYCTCPARALERSK